MGVDSFLNADVSTKIYCKILRCIKRFGNLKADAKIKESHTENKLILSIYFAISTALTLISFLMLCT